MADYEVDGLEASSSRVRKLVNKAKSHGGIVWFLPDEPRTVRYSVDSEDFDEYPGWDFVDAGVVKIVYKNISEDLYNKLLTIRAAENVVRVLPPLNVKKSEIDLAIKVIDKVCREIK